MKTSMFMAASLLAAPLFVVAATPPASSVDSSSTQAQAKRLTEADRKVEAGRILLKWGGYVEKVEGQDRKAWAAAMWPSLASADLDNLQKALRAVTYEGMRNALLGQRPYDEEVIDRMARTKGMAIKTLGQAAADLVFTPITPCRIVDTRVTNDRLGVGATRNLDASNVGGNFTAQGGSDTNCGIPANPAALALSVTGLGNTTTGYLRVFPYNGTNAQGSPVPLNAVNTTVTNDIIVPASQGATQELKIFSTANTHYAAFVTGYFMAPQATALDCTVIRGASDSLVAGFEGDVQTPTCAAGYRATGGDCAWAGAIVNKGGAPYPFTSGSAPTAWICHLSNPTAGSLSYIPYTSCCRIPGR